ncbi:MAG: ATP-binding cassette domain-containing protein [Jiangellaceae bacterium]
MTREGGSALGGAPAIVVDDVTKRYGELRALDGVDVEVPPGGVLGLLGPNGAGKTTVVRILTTLLPPDAGRAAVAGFDVVSQAPSVRSVIGLSGQYAAVDAYLTGAENLQMISRLCGLTRSATTRRAEELLDLFDLTGAAGRTVRTYSAGMRRRLDVAASLVARPAVLFLDEPTTGLDPRGRIGLWRLLAGLTSEGTTVLLTTQYLEEADQLADQIVVIDAGRVIATGTVEQLKTQIGGDRLELQTLPGDDPAPLAAALAGLGPQRPMVDVVTGKVVVPVTNGPGVLLEVATRLAQAGLRVADLALRRPTLDDVFLALTGQPTVPASTGRSAPSGRPA